VATTTGKSEMTKISKKEKSISNLTKIVLKANITYE
jgi:hypothetical protein